MNNLEDIINYADVRRQCSKFACGAEVFGKKRFCEEHKPIKLSDLTAAQKKLLYQRKKEIQDKLNAKSIKLVEDFLESSIDEHPEFYLGFMTKSRPARKQRAIIEAFLDGDLEKAKEAAFVKPRITKKDIENKDEIEETEVEELSLDDSIEPIDIDTDFL